MATSATGLVLTTDTRPADALETQVPNPPVLETLLLDSRNSGAVHTTGALSDGVTYWVRITGTVSPWSVGFMENACGAAEPAPMTPSPGVTNGKVGYDAEMIFGARRGHSLCGSLPVHHPNLHMDDGSGFTDREPVGGRPSAPAPGHSYLYRVTGSGVPLGVHFVDSPHSDNYGVFTIDVSGFQPLLPAERFGPNPVMRCQSVHEGSAGDPVSTATGNLHMPLPGLVVPGRGPGLSWALGYNSLAAADDSSVGFGWSNSFDMRLRQHTDGSVVVHQETGATVLFWPDGAGGWEQPDRARAELVDHPDGSWTFTRGHFELFDFDDTGRLMAIRDLDGNVTSLVYDGNALDYAEDATGRRLDVTWSGGRISQITDPRSAADGGARSVHLTYTNGDLTTFTDVAGNDWAMTYDQSHRMVTLSRPRHGGAAVVETHYDAVGRVDWQDDELDRRTEFHYDDPEPAATRVVFADGDERVDHYDAHGLRTKVVAGYGTAAATETAFTYGTSCTPLTVTDGAGNTWTHEYDAAGNRTRTVDPLGRETLATFNHLDQPLTTTDAEGTVTAYTYDAVGHVDAVTVAAGTPAAATVDFVYGDLAHPEDITAVVDERGKVWQSTYDADGYRVSAADPTGTTTTWAHSSIGWLTEAVAPAGNAPGGDPADHRTTFTYTDHGDPATVTDPLGETTTYDYDANRNRTSMSGPDGDVTTTVYDDADQPVEVTSGAGTPEAATVTSGYHPDGTLAFWEDALSGRRSYGHDAAGRVIAETDPNGEVTAYGYDGAGRLVELVQPGGSCSEPSSGCITYGYDDAAQLTSVDYSDPGTPDVTYGYDDAGRRTTAATSEGTSTWEWDRRGRLVRHTDAAGTAVDYTWDPASNLTGDPLSGPDGAARAHL